MILRALLLAATLVAGLFILPAADGAAAPAHKPAAPDIPLSTRLRCIIRPTLLGLVPPDDPEDYGEVLVRVVAIDGQKLSLHYEIKERVDKQVPLLPQAAGVQAQPEPEQRPRLLPQRSRREPAESAAPEQMKTVAATRIRRGEIAAQRQDGVHRVDSPLFWGDGDWQTDSGLLWLSPAAYAELKAAGGTAWDPASLQWEASPELAELEQLIAARRAANNLAPDDPARLELASAARYPCIVNGMRADLPALLCRDSLGLAQCWILDDADNPMLLKLTYLPQDPGRQDMPEASAAAAEPAAGEVDAAAAQRRPSLVPDRRRQRDTGDGAGGAGSESSPTAQQDPAAEAATGDPGVISEGSGFAVVELNF